VKKRVAIPPSYFFSSFYPKPWNLLEIWMINYLYSKPDRTADKQKKKSGKKYKVNQ
jgi:hypothetical protein